MSRISSGFPVCRLKKYFKVLFFFLPFKESETLWEKKKKRQKDISMTV